MASLLAPLTLLALAASPLPSAVSAPTRWKVTGTELHFEMTDKDLRAFEKDRPVFGLEARRAAFLERVMPAKADTGTDTSTWEAEHVYSVLSVVGGYVSYELVNTGYSGGAHPYAGDIYVTEAAADPKRKMTLWELFPEADVVAALKADSFLRKHASDVAAFTKAKTVAALIQTLNGDEDCVSFIADSERNAFAFHHLEGNQVAVRLVFPYGTEVCRGTKTVVSLLLPIPEKLRAPLERAAKRTEGFLMKDVRAAHAPELVLAWSGAKSK